ncbi:helix-turn-helix domain-containing protein [Peribacillus muralis]|uniref:helix-turn-helix domain-containing protein n=1 Tax=Peribacillus muralis TaxID=264697 RepID=UPI00366B178F
MAYKRWKALTNETAIRLLEGSSIEIVCKLGELMTDRGINQTELSRLTGIRQATINDIIHDKKHTMNKEHTMILMLVLKLTDINQLYEVKFNDIEEEVALKKERDYATLNGLTDEQERILSEHRKKD